MPAAESRLFPAVSRPAVNRNERHVDALAMLTEPQRMRLVAVTTDVTVLDVPIEVHSRSWRGP